MIVVLDSLAQVNFEEDWIVLNADDSDEYKMIRFGSFKSDRTR